MSSSLRRLPDAELDVMQALWQCTPPAERTDIEAILHKTHPVAVTTLLTLLTRLSEKGYISIEKHGRRSQYIPRVSQEEYLAAQSMNFFKKACGGSLATFANALCGSGLTREEIDELRALLERGEL